MSKNHSSHNERRGRLSSVNNGLLNIEENEQTKKVVTTNKESGSEFFSKVKERWWLVAVIGLLSLGVLGSTLKYLDENAKTQLAKRNAATPLNPHKESLLDSVNPFLPAPLPTATPQLAKEYIYAGSRLLAVEDANANAGAPADLAIWRPSTGYWWVMGSATSQQAGVSWGSNGDIPVPGDYDGDGKTDFSIFRPSASVWWIMKSSDNTFYSLAFGASGDKTAPADYDGDGRTDATVFRPSTGYWYIQQSTSGFISQQFGLSTDVPAAADYDGDGKADLAVWRSSDTNFYSYNSSNNQLNVADFNGSGTEVVSADYDGDGKADYAVRNGTDWNIRKSSSNQIETVVWQQSSDKAVQNDYDGDGKVDIAVWHESNGNWYIRKSGSNGGLRQEAWGQPGDIPVPAFYRR
ncbi:MAG TPA: VCBS repeat-containing protein [Pyrinomonadaceae bacterium]|nr:VCBS repeat-containing protein [Pyrinomonadaceae bacterium]